MVKFAGHFHGWHDQVILGAQPPFEIPTPGILQDVIDSTIICPPNDVQALEKVLENDDDIACVIIEPTGASFGTIPTDERFLRPLREMTDRYGIVLLFDEVISGFRVAPGGAQAHYGVIPDLTALAKILAGGYPGGALAGRREIMELLEIRDDPKWMRDRKMPHQGTFNANPVSAAAGIETLKLVRTGVPSKTATKMAARLRKGMNEVIDSFRLNWCIYGTFSEFRYLIGHDLGDVRAEEIDPSAIAYTKLKRAVDPTLVQNLRCGLLLHGVDAPAHGGLTMAAHSEEDIDRTIQAFEKTLHKMKQSDLL